MPDLHIYDVNLDGRHIGVSATSKLDAERKAIRAALNDGADPDYLLSLTDDQVVITRA